MSKDEILELLRLRGWSRTKLAAELNMSENAIQRWIMGDRNPSAAASIVLRQWLNESREREKLAEAV